MRIKLFFALNILTLSILSKNINAATLIDLGILPVDPIDYSYAYGVSANGNVIVGYGGRGFETDGAFKYTNGSMTEINFGDTPAQANAVSADGTIIVGMVNRVAIKYSDGVVTNLGLLNHSIANAISGDGTVIVGTASDNLDTIDTAFKYVGSTPSAINNTIGGTQSRAFGVSYDGSIIVGSATVAGGNFHAFKYEGTTMTDLHTLADGYAGESVANAISADGSTIVGKSYTNSGNNHAFKYTTLSGMTDIGTLAAGDAGESIAYAVSGDGSIIVGSSNPHGSNITNCAGSTSGCHAFKYQNGSMTDLGTLTGGNTSVASGISADGKVIVGTSQTTDSAAHAFMMRIDSTTLVDVNNTALSIANNARQLNSIINLNENNIIFALDQDATLFGHNNINVTVGTRYTRVNPYSLQQLAATLKVAYRFNDHLRAGIFLDQSLDNNMPVNYALRNTQPVMGVFTTLSQHHDGTGAQLHLSAAYSKADLSIARTNNLANTEAGRGNSNITSRGALAEASYGFRINNNLVDNFIIGPVVGLRLSQVTRDSYVEDSGADFPISYKNMNNKATTGLAGLKFSTDITYKLSLQAKLLVEHDLQRSVTSYQGDVSYLGAFNISSPHLRRNRGVGSLNGVYKINDTREIGFGVIYTQHSLNGNDAITGYLNYAMGL